MVKKLIHKLRKGLLPLVCLLITCTITFMYNYEPLFFKYLNHKLFDVFLEKVHSTQTTGVPFIVDIDEASLKEFGQWPWPRYRMARLLEKIQNAGAKAISLDILFAEADRASLGVLKQDLKRDLKVDVQFTGLPDALLDNDRILANVLAKGPFVLGHYFYFHKSAQQLADPFLHPLNLPIINAPDTADSQDYLLAAQSVLPTIQVLSERAISSGFINAMADQDGILRSTPLLLTWRGQLYPSLALAALWIAFDQPAGALKMSSGGIESLRLGKLSIPVDQNGRLLLHFRGPGHTFPYISASDVLKDKLAPQSLAGKIVFVGTSATGLHDLRPTPLDPSFPGVEVHATIIDNILAGDYFFKPDWVPGLEIILIIFTAFITGLLIMRLKALWVLPVVLVISTLIWYGSVFALGRWRMFISPLFPILSLIMNFSLLTLFKFRISEKKKRFLKATFKSYLPPEVIDELYKNNVMPRLGGESRNITAFFSDISSFSSFSEKLTAEQLVEVLNEYLSAMTNILADHKGTLDKYEGDGIAAFFNAPLEFDDHALKACKTAVAMQKKQLELRAKWQGEKTSPQEPDRNIKKLPPEEWTPGNKWPDAIGQMTIRIGINTGEIVVGNMGSEFRMEYTMNGDAVNLASRLEQTGKQYGVGILASEYTLDSENSDENGKVRTAGDMMAIRFIDNIIVVGRSEPVKVYEVRAEKDNLTEDEKTLFKLFDEAMACYQEMKWDQAIAGFTQSLKFEHSPDGKTDPSSVYIERCRLYKDNPPVAPGEIWDGVHTLTKK